MSGGDGIGTRAVNSRVNRERGGVNGRVALDNLAGIIHQDEVRDANMSEVKAEGVDPEVMRKLGIARGDVARDALAESEAGEEPEGPRQLLLTMAALLGEGLKYWRARDALRSSWGLYNRGYC